MAVQSIQSLDDLRHRREQIMTLARQHRVRHIAVFGSLLRGALKSNSDIDFLVDFESDYSLRDHIRLAQGLQELLGRRIEVVDRLALRPELRDTITKEARRL
ncbi:MAG: nucleotidyltransferase domain-containing protein [Chloroflexi bacterium]|nr:nucleotidyltransferase domain-containing protein [Chloroflexota bacterium]